MVFSTIDHRIERLRWWLRLQADSLHAVPTAVLAITEQCSSRCNCCDYWRFGRYELSLELARQLAESLSLLGTRYVLLTGGEPLQHPHWVVIASLFKAKGIRIALATSGILLTRHGKAVQECADELFISLDGATPETYKAVRGLDGLGLLERGVQGIAESVPMTFRTTVQRANYLEIPAMIRLTRSWGAAHHSFLAVDVHSQAAFARSAEPDQSVALGPEDLGRFAGVLDEMERDFEAEFASGFISESKAKMRNLHAYFAALQDLRTFPPVKCNAPGFSVFIHADGTFKPCFFLPSYGRLEPGALREALNAPAAKSLRRQQRLGLRTECVRCVCPAFKCSRDFFEGA